MQESKWRLERINWKHDKLMIEMEAVDRTASIEIVNRVDGTILHFERRRRIGLYQIGAKIEISGAVPIFYVVRDNYIGVDYCGRRWPHRQTLVVDRI